MPRSIVVLDTDGELEPLAAALELASKEPVVRVSDAADLYAYARDGACDLALVDRDQGGLEVLARLRELDAELPVVVVAAQGGVSPARDAIAAGASDFLVRGGDLAERAETMLKKAKKWARLARENRDLRRSLEERYLMIGRSPQMKDVLSRIMRVAKVPRPVLVLGERGTGKELVARALHEASEAKGPFVVVNCAAVAESLLESELFGHERGAFTGADRKTAGKFEIAAEGTLFLDEIGHMSLAFQQKILRAVEYGAFLRVGGAHEIEVRPRIIAATNADLKEMIRRGEFLPDLHDRLAFEEIRLPSLRERKGDIALLADFFLERFVREVPAFRGKRLSPRVLSLLERYPFPGNVRELKNIIERAVYRETGEELTADDLGLDAHAHTPAVAGSFRERVETFERELVEEALRESGGNQAEAARRLGLSYHQLRYYRAKHGAE